MVKQAHRRFSFVLQSNSYNTTQSTQEMFFLIHPSAIDTKLFLFPTHRSPLPKNQLLNSSTNTKLNHQQSREYCISNVLSQERIQQIKQPEN